MMINKRLIQTVGESKKYIAAGVLWQWCSLLANVGMIFTITWFLQRLFFEQAVRGDFLLVAVVCAASLLLRYICTRKASDMSYLSAKAVKKTLRSQIFKKLLHLGPAYSQQVPTSEVVQITVEGVDQLETYFGAYLPQFFYSMLAPLTLFAVLAPISLPSAIALLVCVPLIPVSIAAVQTFAKKLLSRYWSQYTTLGDTFLENLQGLTTLKIYRADAYKNQQMNEEAEKFRKITMRVLTMQLNSITVMDLVAYGGAALGVVLSVTRYRAGAVSLAGCLAIILLSADFFIPMRQLGSFFHIAMNGMAASDKIFHLLDLPQPPPKHKTVDPRRCTVTCRKLCYTYAGTEREVLHQVDMDIPAKGLTAVVGDSGCGKSTIASILTGRSSGYSGSACIDGDEIADLNAESLLRSVVYVGHGSYLFAGTVRENLQMAAPQAEDAQLWAVLERAHIADFLQAEQGLDTAIAEGGSNFSGGQCQRLALARALLYDAAVYIFDEATSNVDVESENDIMEQIVKLAEEKTVILISHRLAAVVPAQNIYVLQAGRVVESGTHHQLLERQGHYHALWSAQQELEMYGEGGIQ
ncbi:ABC transporter ATP-binding protein/permease [Neobittarella massiliensis]|uniref:ABC transporter ATP-binding protein/permease n=1 Tax=Neobittarella massiliensis (ex Bilen et al. 2018) TaxID=2041842 RepID=UPI000CF74457|nr:ABC transporter ATP-binding protein/permease [Neobittarella massiliensis]